MVAYSGQADLGFSHDNDGGDNDGGDNDDGDDDARRHNATRRLSHPRGNGTLSTPQQAQQHRFVNCSSVSRGPGQTKTKKKTRKEEQGSSQQYCRATANQLAHTTYKQTITYKQTYVVRNTYVCCVCALCGGEGVSHCVCVERECRTVALCQRAGEGGGRGRQRNERRETETGE